jgi:hypothetical protein
MRTFPRVVLFLTVAATTAAPQPADTVFLSVGSPGVDGTIFKPHATRVRVYVGETLTADWTQRAHPRRLGRPQSDAMGDHRTPGGE